MEKFLQILQEEFKSTLLKSAHSTLRQYHFTEAKNLAKVAVGIRHSGKTYSKAGL